MCSNTHCFLMFLCLMAAWPLCAEYGEVGKTTCGGHTPSSLCGRCVVEYKDV